MEPIDPPFDWAAYDELVLATPDIDHFCTSSAWTAPADRFIHPRRHDASLALEVDGVVHRLMARITSQMGLRVLQPLEASWGLACPILGPRPDLAAPRLAELLLELDSWDLLSLSGLPTGAPWVDDFVDVLAQRVPTERGWTVQRHVADLSDGVDAWLARRSARFRRNLRRALRVAEAAGVTYERADDQPLAPLCARLQTLEDGCWKAGIGATYIPGGSFYGEMVVRLAAAGRLRVTFARLDGADVGYIFGGVLGDTYRGQQFSYADEHGDLSLGNLLQWHQMHDAVAEGLVRYDLGTTADWYKRRWADATVTSDTVRSVSPHALSLFAAP